MTISIRRRLTLRLLCALSCLLVVCGAILFVGVRKLLESRFDSALDTKARSLVMLVLEEHEHVEFEFADEVMPEFKAKKQPSYFELRKADGTSIERSRSLGDSSLLAPGQPVEFGSPWDLRLPDGRDGRAIALRFAPQDLLERDGDVDEVAAHDQPYEIVVAQGRESIERAMSALLIGLLAVGALFVVGVVVIVRRSVEVGLAPLEDLSAAVGELEAEALDLRLSAADLPIELRPILERLQQSLVRLSSAFNRERQFTSSAAHELRTPIAELRALSQFALRWPDDEKSRGDTLSSVVEVTHRMERVVDHLLRLARADSFTPELELEDVDLRGLLDDLWAPLARAAEDKQLRCRIEVQQGTTLRTDRTLLGSVLGNLLQNAVEHAPRGGRLELRCEADGDALELDVLNTNAALEASDLERMFEPFWRKDAGRSSAAHSGLGLALAAALAKPLHVSLRPELRGGDFVMRARMPKSIGRRVASVAHA